MKYIIITGIFLACAIIQTLFIESISVFGIKPNLILLAVVFFCLRAGWEKGLLLGMIAGLCIDIFTVGRFGLGIISMGIVGLILGYFTKRLYFENPLTQSIITFFITFIFGLIYFSLSGIFYNSFLWDLYLIKVVPQAFYNLFLSLIVFIMIWRLEHRRLFN